MGSLFREEAGIHVAEWPPYFLLKGSYHLLVRILRKGKLTFVNRELRHV